MKQARRQIYILEQIKVSGEVSSKKLSEILNVSTMTISRDLKEIAKKGNIELTHGGAIIRNIDMQEHSMSIKEAANIEGKKKIASFCRTLTEDATAIFIETGTTTLAVAKEIFRKENCDFYTNSLLVLNALSKHENIALHSVPGKYRELSKGFLGVQTVNYIQDFNYDIAFIGAEGVDPQGGVTLPNEDDAYTKKAIIKRSKKVVLVTDFSKFGLIHRHRAAKLNEIDVIITDLSTQDPLFKSISKQTRIISVYEQAPR